MEVGWPYPRGLSKMLGPGRAGPSTNNASLSTFPQRTVTIIQQRMSPGAGSYGLSAPLPAAHQDPGGDLAAPGRCLGWRPQTSPMVSHILGKGRPPSQGETTPPHTLHLPQVTFEKPKPRLVTRLCHSSLWSGILVPG